MSGSLGTVPDIIMGKDPMKALRDNALMAGAVLTGGAMLPAAAGAAGAGAAAEGATGAFLGEGMASGIPAWDAAATSANPSLLSYMKTAGEYAKPVGQAAQAAGQAGLLGGQRQPIMPSPITQPQPGANQMLASIAQMPSMGTQQMQEAEQMRQRRRMGLLGGGYGSA